MRFVPSFSKLFRGRKPGFWVKAVGISGAHIYLILLLMAGTVYGVAISNGGYSDVTSWTSPRRITNSCGGTAFVPTNSQAEWNSVINSSPACLGKTTLLRLQPAGQSCGSGYGCSANAVWAPSGGTAEMDVNCDNTHWVGGQRLLDTGFNFIKYCGVTNLGNDNYRISCGSIPSNSGYIQYWNDPCI